MSAFVLDKSKKLCIIYANCQGDALYNLLHFSKDFLNKYQVLKFTNYKNESPNLNILESCDLFIYQYLQESWQEYATDYILTKLPAKCQALCIPNMFFQGYWSFWTKKSKMQLGDKFLDSLLERGLTNSEIFHLYSKSNLYLQYNPQEKLAETLEIESNKEKRNICSTVDLVRQYYQTEALFSSINHPNLRLLLHVVNAILRELKLALIYIDLSTPIDVQTYLEFEQIIHPLVAKELKLQFYNPHKKWQIYTNKLNFEQYTLAYIDCYQHDYDFIAYLHSLK